MLTLRRHSMLVVQRVCRNGRRRILLASPLGHGLHDGILLLILTKRLKKQRLSFFIRDVCLRRQMKLTRINRPGRVSLIGLYHIRLIVRLSWKFRGASLRYCTGGRGRRGGPRSFAPLLYRRPRPPGGPPSEARLLYRRPRPPGGVRSFAP